LGLRSLYLKIEGANPTGSFKDRGMVVAVAKASRDGARSVICASTGNTSASAAAYAAAAGSSASSCCPKGAIALGKLLQALVRGAASCAVDGQLRRRACRIVRGLAEQDDTGHAGELGQPVSGSRAEDGGVRDLRRPGPAPDVLAIPVGNAGNISAYWRGFGEYAEPDRRVAAAGCWGFQAAGAAPLVPGSAVERPETLATAIRIGNPARGRRRSRP
jgi:threonine synthase